MIEIVVTPEELYYLGTLLQAKYIDYAYIAAMDDVAQNYHLFEADSAASLVQSGLILEDFSGNIEVKEFGRELLRPVFFGETEASVNVCEISEGNRTTVRNFHYYEDRITMVRSCGKKLIIREVDFNDIINEVEIILPEDYSYDSELIIEKLDNKKITKVIAVKITRRCKGNEVKIFVEHEGVVYEDDNSKITGLTKERFIKLVTDVIKGV